MEERSHDSFVGYRLFRAQRRASLPRGALEPYGITPRSGTRSTSLRAKDRCPSASSPRQVGREPRHHHALDRPHGEGGAGGAVSRSEGSPRELSSASRRRARLLSVVQPAARCQRARRERFHRRGGASARRAARSRVRQLQGGGLSGVFSLFDVRFRMLGLCSAAFRRKAAHA